MSRLDQERARGFDAWAGEYDRFRPGYPDALFDTIATRLDLPERPCVVDLGAGTGRATLAMAERGWRVTAVEPGRPMLDLLRSAATDAGLLVATVQAPAEETGLDPGSADLVTAAQSFHWFDKSAALTEIARILRPGGGLALFWNVRDGSRSPFLADYEQLLQRSVQRTDAGRYEWEGREATQRAFESHASAFEPPEIVELHHEVVMTDADFIGLAFTASYIKVGLTPEEQDRFRLELAALLGRHGLNDGRPFAVPYRIDLWIARRRGT
ncbi:MAG TPA: class I SAM-dependent methyltransferase [candidate division Zixibacteria bacterium]|nr:class I SAM-dependent methyltransferase [candidate division Zixibacteria bacterium]